jgi:hypothetical protein
MRSEREHGSNASKVDSLALAAMSPPKQTALGVQGGAFWGCFVVVGKKCGGSGGSTGRPLKFRSWRLHWHAAAATRCDHDGHRAEPLLLRHFVPPGRWRTVCTPFRAHEKPGGSWPKVSRGGTIFQTAPGDSGRIPRTVRRSFYGERKLLVGPCPVGGKHSPWAVAAIANAIEKANLLASVLEAKG